MDVLAELDIQCREWGRLVPALRQAPEKVWVAVAGPSELLPLGQADAEATKLPEVQKKKEEDERMAEEAATLLEAWLRKLQSRQLLTRWPKTRSRPNSPQRLRKSCLDPQRSWTRASKTNPPRVWGFGF